MTPHTCPVCQGMKQIRNPDPYGYTASPLVIACPTCQGAGVLWEPEGLREALPHGHTTEEALEQFAQHKLRVARAVRRSGDAPKTLDVTSSADFPAKVADVEVFGNPDRWKLVCKASSKSQGWMKSTKAMGLPGGVLVQVSTQQGDHVAEALCFIPCMDTANVLHALGFVSPAKPPQTVSVDEALKPLDGEEDEQAEAAEAAGSLNGSVFKEG